MNIMLTGATGHLGTHITNQAITKSHRSFSHWC